MVQNFTLVQKSALSLIQTDLQFLYTVTKRIDSSQSNYIPSLLPYMGVIIDGVEDWIKAYNNSHVEKLDLPTFTKEEEWYYEKMRESVKMWELHYNEIFAIFKPNRQNKRCPSFNNMTGKVRNKCICCGKNATNNNKYSNPKN